MVIHNDFLIKDVLWYKIGGRVRYLLDVQSRDDALQALDFIKDQHITKVFVVGLGANLIFSDEYFDGAVIRIVESGVPDIQLVEATQIQAFAGVLLDQVITFGFQHNLVGLSWAGGLPGTVGAAVRGNVGAYGGEVKDTLVSAEVVRFTDGKSKVLSLTNEDLAFAYRESLVKKSRNMIVLSAIFGMQSATQEEVEVAQAEYQGHIDQRKARHPLEYPNCGSVFKNIRKPEEVAKVLAVYPDLADNMKKKWYGKVAAAALIERLGLQGYRVGDAEVSKKHALFIVNLGNATAKDVITIINTIQGKFLETFGFHLEPEVEIVK